MHSDTNQTAKHSGGVDGWALETLKHFFLKV